MVLSSSRLVCNEERVLDLLLVLFDHNEPPDQLFSLCSSSILLAFVHKGSGGQDVSKIAATTAMDSIRMVRQPSVQFDMEATV